MNILHYVALLLVDQFDYDDFLSCWTTYDHLDGPRTKTKMIDQCDFLGTLNDTFSFFKIVCRIKDWFVCLLLGCGKQNSKT